MDDVGRACGHVGVVVVDELEAEVLQCSQEPWEDVRGAGHMLKGSTCTPLHTVYTWRNRKYLVGPGKVLGVKDLPLFPAAGEGQFGHEDVVLSLLVLGEDGLLPRLCVLHQHLSCPLLVCPVPGPVLEALWHVFLHLNHHRVPCL